MVRWSLPLLALLTAAASAFATPPVASYIFPAGGQRGTKIDVRVGGLFLHEECGFEMRGQGVTTSPRLKRTKTLWFEGPLLPLPQSQRAEDYPKDMSGQVDIAADALIGVRPWRLWTSQGATPALKFIVGELPEIVEAESEGDPVPMAVTLPVTVNGRIFPREDIDVWTFRAQRGQRVRCEVHAARLGSPLEAHLEILDATGRRLVENDTQAGDPVIRCETPADGDYQVRIHDTRFDGGQAFVYRLTLTSEPIVAHFFPLGGRRDSAINVQLTGQNVPDRSVSVRIPAPAPGRFGHRFDVGGKMTNEVWFETDDLPEHLSPSPEPVTLPAVFNGRIDTPGKVDRWTWTGRKGDAWEFDLRAAELGSPLDGVISIVDPTGKTVFEADSTMGGPLRRDPAIVPFTVPGDGAYAVQIRDRFRSRGGPDFAYRLRATPLTPDFQLWLGSDALSLPRKGNAKLKLTATRRGGHKEPITLKVTGLPTGVTFTPTTIAPNQSSLELTFKAAPDAGIQVSHLTIEGEAKDLRHTAALPAPWGETPLDDVLLAVALPTPFKIKGDFETGFAARGSTHQRRYVIERDGYDGPIEISLADRQARHLQGVTGPSITVPAGAHEFIYEATMPPWMETGRTSRTCVMGVATLEQPDGSKHRVCFSSVNQNEQIVAVVGPGRLGLALERPSVLATPGGRIALPFQIKRDKDLGGAIKVELVVPSHMRGIAAEALLVPGGEERGTLTLRFDDAAAGPFNMPLVIRATTVNGALAYAEARVEIVRKE